MSVWSRRDGENDEYKARGHRDNRIREGVGRVLHKMGEFFVQKIQKFQITKPDPLTASPPSPISQTTPIFTHFSFYFHPLNKKQQNPYGKENISHTQITNLNNHNCHPSFL